MGNCSQKLMGKLQKIFNNNSFILLNIQSNNLLFAIIYGPHGETFQFLRFKKDSSHDKMYHLMILAILFMICIVAAVIFTTFRKCCRNHATKTFLDPNRGPQTNQQQSPNVNNLNLRSYVRSNFYHIIGLVHDYEY